MVHVVRAAPGVVLAVGGSGGGWAEKLIRIGGVLHSGAGVANHVIGLTHQDELGRWIGLEGRPGGVGMVDATRYLSDMHTRGNYDQVAGFAPDVVTGLLADAAKTIGIRYDWFAIAEDTAEALGANDLSEMIDHLYRWPSGDGQMPGAVVCSSLWAMLYENRNLPHPELGHERCCSPQEWWDWSDGQQWKRG